MALRFLAVIGSVKTGALKDYPYAAADQAFYFFAAFGAFIQRLSRHLLEGLKGMVTMVAFVFVSRHSFLSYFIEKRF